jgi:hypothetical protein
VSWVRRRAIEGTKLEETRLEETIRITGGMP